MEINNQNFVTIKDYLKWRKIDYSEYLLKRIEKYLDNRLKSMSLKSSMIKDEDSYLVIFLVSPPVQNGINKIIKKQVNF